MQGGTEDKMCPRRATCLTLGCKGRVRARGMCLCCYNRASYVRKRTQKCALEDCMAGQFARGLCTVHYNETTSTLGGAKGGRKGGKGGEKKCSTCSRDVYAKGLCSRHYIAQRRGQERAKKLRLTVPFLLATLDSTGGYT